MAKARHGTQPMRVEETPGDKAYCQCGWSAELPYCDGAHARMDTGCQPLLCHVDEPGPKWVCQCRESSKLPWCDGTHQKLAQA